MPETGVRLHSAGFVNGAHVLAVRVYYEDTDAAGVVYHASFLRFADRARTEMLRDLGATGVAPMANEGLGFVVRHCSADFLKPGRLNDLLEVHSRFLEVGGASVTAAQTVKWDGADLVCMQLTLVCTTPAGRPARLPPELWTLLRDAGAQTVRD
mgnify:CR=1 FL=1